MQQHASSIDSAPKRSTVLLRSAPLQADALHEVTNPIALVMSKRSKSIMTYLEHHDVHRDSSYKFGAMLLGRRQVYRLGIPRFDWLSCW